MTTTFSGNLNLTIVDAKDLKNDNYGKKDPYCNVSLGTAGLGGILDGQGIGKERFKTKTHEDAGVHPRWNESHVFDLHGMKPQVRLKIALYDKDMFKDDYLGLAEITLAELIKRKDDLHYFDLTEKGKGYQVVGQIGLIAKFDCTQIPDSIHEGEPVEQKESVGIGAKISQKVTDVKDKIMGQKDGTTEDVHTKEVITKHVHHPGDVHTEGVPGVHREHHIHEEPPRHRHHLAGDIDKFGRDHVEEPPHNRLHLAGDIDKVGRDHVEEPPRHRHHLAGDIDKVGRDPMQPRTGVSEPVDNHDQNMSDMGHDRFRVEPGIIVHDPSQMPQGLGHQGQMKGQIHDQGMKGQIQQGQIQQGQGQIQQGQGQIQQGQQISGH